MTTGSAGLTTTESAQAARDLVWDACYNVRDVGGYLTASGQQTRWRTLIRADNLCRLTPAGEAALCGYGVRTVVDLRLAAELEQSPNPFATSPGADARPRYVNLPLHDQETNALLDAAASAHEQYIIILERNRESVAAAIAAVAAGLAEGGVVVHCHGGKDRTGIVIALLLTLAGVSRSAIIADYAHSATRLEAPNVAWLAEEEQRLGRPVERPRWMEAQPETMRHLLAYLDREYGGVAGYLAAAGLPGTAMTQVRDHLLVPAGEAALE